MSSSPPRPYGRLARPSNQGQEDVQKLQRMSRARACCVVCMATRCRRAWQRPSRAAAICAAGSGDAERPGPDPGDLSQRALHVLAPCWPEQIRKITHVVEIPPRRRHPTGPGETRDQPHRLDVSEAASSRRARSRAVRIPGVPVPIGRPSTLVTGTIPATELARKASSAPKRSFGVRCS